MPTNLLNKDFLSREDIITLLSLTAPDDIAALFQRADEVRTKYVGEEVHLRGIIEISNMCKKRCHYCGLRQPNGSLLRYRMDPDEIVEYALRIIDLPIQTIVLQSGEDDVYSAEEISDIIRRIKVQVDVAITLSLGEKDDQVYRMWFNAGADRYLLKHETANRSLYQKLKPDSNFDARIHCLHALKNIGFQIGTGNMIGLPGQTIEDIADDILLCREIQADMCTFGPFIASPYTPLGDSPDGSVELSLRTIAVARIVLRDVHIPANTAIATIDEHGREKALRCGANIVMPNFTPSKHRIHYQIYPNRKCIMDEPLHCNGCIRAMVVGLGRPVSDGKGHSLKLASPH